MPETFFLKKSIWPVWILALLISAPLTIFAQWAPPTTTPPTGNTLPPLNVSSVGQYKVGGLFLNTGPSQNGLIVQFGNVGIGTLSPTAKFAVKSSGTGTMKSFTIGSYPGIEKVTILDNGKVGVLKLMPSYQIDVSGNINATRFCLAGICRDSWGVINQQWTQSGQNLNYTAGKVSIGTIDANPILTVGGGVQVGTDNAACTSANAGTLRWDGAIIQFCNGNSWTNMQYAALCLASGPCPQSLHGTSCVTNDTQSVPYGSTCPSNTNSVCSNGTWIPAHAQYSGCYVVAPIRGCTNSAAVNYNSGAQADDGSCHFRGCTDPDYLTYNPKAREDDGSCTNEISGCTDTNANNYNPDANTDDGWCTYD